MHATPHISPMGISINCVSIFEDVSGDENRMHMEAYVGVAGVSEILSKYLF